MWIDVCDKKNWPAFGSFMHKMEWSVARFCSTAELLVELVEKSVIYNEAFKLLLTCEVQ